jgi:uncharacterized repeat protein (TIGR03806 family)
MNLRKISLIVFTLGLVLAVFIACQSTSVPALTQKSPEDIDFIAIPYPLISDYGFFKGELNQLLPNDRVLQYRPSSTLFSDYADKSRFIWMPEGVSGSIKENDWQEIDFPDKSILVKNFYYSDAGGKQRIIETRLLVKNNDVWNAYPYLWNEEQSDAVYKMTGATLPVSFNHNGAHYDIDYIQPNKNQCKSCHNQNEILKPIGPKARNMNFELDYGNGEVKNQLAKWQEVGFLNNYDGNYIYQSVPDYTHENVSLNDRARAYLDANCAYCHNPNSPASTSGLTLSYEEMDTNKLGFYKTPVAAGIGAGSMMIDIHPGKADSSILIYRMNSSAQGVAMPELGRVMIHKEGVQLISDWINAMR